MAPPTGPAPTQPQQQQQRQTPSSTTSKDAVPTPSSTSAAAPTPLQHRRPSVDTNTAAINAKPIELDSTPVSPVTRRQPPWPAGSGRPASGLKDGVEAVDDGGEGQGGKGEKRAELLDRRAKDPAVLVDIPQTPDPQEYEVAINIVNGGAVAEKIATARGD